MSYTNRKHIGRAQDRKVLFKNKLVELISIYKLIHVCTAQLYATQRPAKVMWDGLNAVAPRASS